MHDKLSRRNCEAYKFFIIAELFHSFYSIVDGIAEKSVHIARLHFGKNCAVGNTGELYALVAARETLFREDDIQFGISGMHRTVVPRNMSVFISSSAERSKVPAFSNSAILYFKSWHFMLRFSIFSFEQHTVWRHNPKALPAVFCHPLRWIP